MLPRPSPCACLHPVTPESFSPTKIFFFPELQIPTPTTYGHLHFVSQRSSTPPSIQTPGRECQGRGHTANQELSDKFSFSLISHMTSSHPLGLLFRYLLLHTLAWDMPLTLYSSKCELTPLLVRPHHGTSDHVMSLVWKALPQSMAPYGLKY